MERPVIDYYLFLSDLVAETIGAFAQVMKEATAGNAIVGVFYGYVLQLGGEVNLDGVDNPVTSRQRQQNAGHLALRKVWDCPHVDFLTCPTSYEFRWSGRGYSHFSSPIDSLQPTASCGSMRTTCRPGWPSRTPSLVLMAVRRATKRRCSNNSASS